LNWCNTSNYHIHDCAARLQSLYPDQNYHLSKNKKRKNY